MKKRMPLMVCMVLVLCLCLSQIKNAWPAVYAIHYTAREKPVYRGDLDGDHEVSPADARIALRTSVRLDELDEALQKAADIDGDGAVSSADARMILRIAVKLEIMPEAPDASPTDATPTDPEPFDPKDNYLAEALENAVERTYNGVVFTPTGDGGITVSGAATDQSFFNILVTDELPEWLTPGTEFRAAIDSGSEITIDVFERIEGQNSVRLVRTTSGQNFAFTEEAAGTVIRIQVPRGTTVHQTVYPQIIRLENRVSLKVLFIGNSYTLDSMAYTPFILQNIAPTLKLTVGATYYGGATIAQYNDFFDSDAQVLIYDKCRGDAVQWEPRQSGKSVRDAIEDEDWDIICFNQASKWVKKTDSDFSTEIDLMQKVADWNEQSNQKTVRFGWLMPQLRWETKENIRYEDLTSYVKGVLENTSADFIIPCGTAIENARAIPELDKLGNAEYAEGEDGNGHLTYDTNGHLQEGLPVLMTSYVTALTIAKLSGVPCAGILGEYTCPDSAWLFAHKVPGQHGSPEGLSEENRALAQKLALAAFQNPFEVLSTDK